jgi:isocitrate lyase
MNDRPGETIIQPVADRWRGVKRDYTADQMRRLTGSLCVSHTLAERGADRLWQLLHSEPYVAALGALTGNQALQQVKAGLKAIYLSGWQVAADANNAGQMYPDQSLYPASSVPDVVQRINRAFQRAQRRDIGLRMEQLPQPVGAALSERVADAQRAGQPTHLVGRIVALHAAPAVGNGVDDRLGRPVIHHKAPYKAKTRNQP